MWMKECFESFYSGSIPPFNKGNDSDTTNNLGDEESIDGIITPTRNAFDMHLPLLLPIRNKWQILGK